MKNTKNILFIFLFSISLLIGCGIKENHLSKIRKDTDINTLYKELSKDSLFKTFEGFTITPRSWYDNVFIFFRNEDPKIFYWLTYDSRGPKYFKIDRIEKENNRKLIMAHDSLNYMQIEMNYFDKAFELISLMKKLNIRTAVGESWYFRFSFNDSSNLAYFNEPENLDSTYFRIYNNIVWLDSNFVTYTYYD